MSNTKMEVMKLKAEIANCERIAKSAEGSMVKALNDRAATLRKQVSKLEAQGDGSGV